MVCDDGVYAMAKQANVESDPGKSELAKPCGLILPISATSAHDKAHWDAMLELLSRAVDQAGYAAKPVWINSSTDRVSERIIGNIFDHSVVIADITDLNPNVMFELGLRLASKKPTLVVMEEGGDIPFDIRDFHIHVYPQNLSILGMEKFLVKLSDDVKAKKAAFDSGEYIPFLSEVVVDVVSPNEREVSMNQFVFDQLTELNRRVARIDSPPRSKSQIRDYSPDDRIVSVITIHRAVFFTEIAPELESPFVKEAKVELDEVIELNRDDHKISYALVKNGPRTQEKVKELRSLIDTLILKFEGKASVPRYISDRYS